MNGASSENEEIENRLVTFGINGVYIKKNPPPGHTGALLVAMSRHQYEIFIVVVKLSVVERRARRSLKAHIKTHLIHA